MELALINEALFKENSPIKDDTIISKFVPYIVLAQKIYLKEILGAPLYDELQTQIKAANVIPAPTVNPITEDNRALLVMIAPALSMYAVYQGIPFHWAAIVNKGVTLRNSDNSDAVNIKDIAQLRRWLKDDAEVLAKELISYLSNCDKYPLWKPEANCSGIATGTGSTKSPFEAGIYIPKR